MKNIIMIIAIIILFAYTARAETLHAAIGQIQASGATADDEFVELLNPTETAIDIGSWSIQYKSANGSTFYKKNFSKGAAIPAGGRYVVAGSGYAGTCDMKHSSFSLSSSGGTVFLVANQTLLTSTSSPAIVDQKTYAADALPASADGGVNPNTNTPPDAMANAPITATQHRATDPMPVSVNEFMPAPAEGDEWIELYNGGGSAIDLANWTFADGTGNIFLKLNGLIMPADFKLMTLNAGHLNNDGDMIVLRDADKNIIDAVCYGDWPCDKTPAPIGTAGAAVARLGDGRDTNNDGADFAATASPTPGSANKITAPSTNDERLTTSPKTIVATGTKISKNETQWLTDLLAKQSEAIAKLLKADNIIIINNLNIGTGETKAAASAAKAPIKTATTVSGPSKTTAKTFSAIQGTVIVPAGIVGKDVCVVREEKRSVEVRLPKDLKTMPVPGDTVSASGAWSTAKTINLPRLLVKTAAAFQINDHDDPLPATAIPMEQIGDHLGEIISTTGTVVEKQPTRLRIADGETSLLIKTNFETAKGDKLSATGLLEKSAADNLLITLTPDALAIIKPPPAAAPSVVQKALPYGLAILPAGILSTAVYLGKKLRKRKEVMAHE